MLEKVKKYQDQWENLPDGAKQIAELIAVRKALQSEILDDDGNMISLWDYALNRELEVLSAETGFARDTDEDPEDVCASFPRTACLFLALHDHVCIHVAIPNSTLQSCSPSIALSSIVCGVLWCKGTLRNLTQPGLHVAAP